MSLHIPSPPPDSPDTVIDDSHDLLLDIHSSNMVLLPILPDKDIREIYEIVRNDRDCAMRLERAKELIELKRKDYCHTAAEHLSELSAASSRTAQNICHAIRNVRTALYKTSWVDLLFLQLPEELLKSIAEASTSKKDVRRSVRLSNKTKSSNQKRETAQQLDKLVTRKTAGQENRVAKRNAPPKKRRTEKR